MPSFIFLKSVVFTSHAERVLSERAIKQVWIIGAVREPDWVVLQPNSVDVRRHFKFIPENDNRVLRVVCLESEAEIRIISAFFDRKAKKPE